MVEGPVGETPLALGSVHVLGAQRTSTAAIEFELKGARRCRTLAALHGELSKATNHLRGTGVFDGVEMVLDASEEVGKANLNVKLREKGLLGLNVGTYAGGSGGLTMEVAGQLRNPFGQCDYIKGTYKKGARGNSSSLGYSVPRTFGEPLQLDLLARDTTLDYEYTASHRQQLRGVQAALSTRDGVHRWEYNFDLRNALPRMPEEGDALAPSARAAPRRYKGIVSREMVEETERGASNKSSVAYTYSSDSRDSPSAPTTGDYLSLTAEAAGFTGDAKFLRAGGDVQHNRHLAYFAHGPLSLSLGASLEAVRPFHRVSELLDPASPPPPEGVRIFDRLFQGGPTILRGFEHMGVGKRAEGGSRFGDALGGEIAGRLLASLSMPLPIPKLAENGVRLQGFCNYGNLVDWQDLYQGSGVDAFFETARASAGVGVYMALGHAARLEVNYSWILRQQSQDATRNLQIGLGVGI